MSYEIENMKFTIFGSGHDYTLLDSGAGEKVIFSHPFVPKGAWLSAGQFYFTVPDEHGDMFDAVWLDYSHCTFTPAIGSIFNTEGEVTVKVEYYREYVYPEETLVVQKKVEQVITVVDHGQIVSSDYTHDVYEDGYCYIRPSGLYPDSERFSNEYERKFTKCSSIPWRAYSLQNMLTNSGCTDISELSYADTSKVSRMDWAFQSCGIIDLKPIKDWDVSSVMTTSHMFGNNGNLIDLSPLSKWNLSNVTNMSYMFSQCYNLVDLLPLKNWDVSSAYDMSYMFQACNLIVDLTPLSKWNVSNVRNMSNMFRCLFDAKYDDWSFYPKRRSADGLEDWDVSNVTDFSHMFEGAVWLDDISALANWDMSSGINFESMLYGYSGSNLNGITWNLSSAENIQYMFSMGFIGYSVSLGINLFQTDYINPEQEHDIIYFDVNGNSYTKDEVGEEFEYPAQNASNASTWTVLLTNAHAFKPLDTIGGGWINIPAWN